MEIIKAENCGFCMGVENAVSTAKKYANANACALGEIIHNKKVIDELSALNITTVHSLCEIAPFSSVIIRSHGERKEVVEEILRLGKDIVDLTCPFVKKIHEIVKEYKQKGYKIVIAGDKNHSEVIGINSFTDYTALIVDQNSTLFELKGEEKVCFVAQTTIEIKNYQIILEKIKKLCLKVVEVFDTICYTTYTRQQEAAKIARCSNKVLVIGSKNSSNTSKLLEICQNICPSFLVEDILDLTQINFSPSDKVGIITGASAPMELVLEVCLYMSEKAENAAVQEEVEAVVPAAEQQEAAAPQEEKVAIETNEQVAEDAPKQEGEEKHKKEKGAKKAKSEESSLFRAEMEKKPVNLKIGRKYRVEILSVDDKGIFVALGNNKRDGFIPPEEAGLEEFNPSNFKVGEVIFAILKSQGDKATGCHILSKRDVDIEKEADKAVDPIRDGSEFALTVTSETKGGLVGNIASYRVFIPSSHIREVGYPKSLSQYVGKTLRLSALEIDDKKHKIVASQKVILAAEREKREEGFWNSIEVGQIVSGKVVRASQFGAFVDVNGFDCLAHIGDLSWTHISKVEDALKIGESYDFVVLSLNRENSKVSLGYKQLKKHPFDEIIETYPVGTNVKGTIVRIVNFGAFVQIAKGVDALLHLSEASHSYIKSISEVFKVGDEIEAQVIRIDPDKKKISISVKALLPEPQFEEKAEREDRSEKADKPKTVRRGAREGGEEGAGAPEGRREERSKREFKRPEFGDRRRPSKIDHKDDGPREWSEELSNNPFADLLKEFNIDKDEKK